MGKCKTKAIQADLGIFTHVPAYSGTFRLVKPYSGILRHIHEFSRHIQTYSGSYLTLAYAKPWYIQNPGMFRTRGIFNPIIIFSNYNYFLNINFPCSLLHEIYIMIFFNTGLIFTPEVFILCKNVWGSRGLVNFDILFSYQKGTDFNSFLTWHTAHWTCY